MGTLRYIVCIFLFFNLSCTWQQTTNTNTGQNSMLSGKAALLTTRFSSLEELKKVIKIEYTLEDVPQVSLTHSSNGQEVNSVIRSGISELDIINAKKGGFWDHVSLGLNSPYVVINRKDIMRVYLMARIRCNLFGEGDVAFYNISEAIVHNISDDDTAGINSRDLTEKGFINTFNHITAQALMTSVFSERLADFISDVHELRKLPELVTGKFTKEQINDIEEGPVDNYIDIINNEWGQELGKVLRKKYNISRETNWTPELLANYLNDVQSYYSWVFQIGFKPFRASDEIVIRFSGKINSLLMGVSGLGFIDLIFDLF